MYCVPFVDRVLMGTGESGEGQLARIWPALRHVHLGAALVNLADMVDMREIELRVNALRVHVHAPRVTISRLPVRSPLPNSVPSTRSAPASMDSSAASDARAAVVVRMDGDDRRVAVGQMADEVLNLVGIGVGRAHFHRVGQVENDRVFFRRAEASP